RGHELRAGEEGVDRVPLQHQADHAEDLWVAPAGRSADSELPSGRLEEARDHMQQGCLPRAVRAEQPGDPGPDGHRDVVDSHDVAVPAGDVAELDRGHATPIFRYRAIRPPMPAARKTPNVGPKGGPYLPAWGISPLVVPPSHMRRPSRSVNGLRSPAKRASADGPLPGAPRPCRTIWVSSVASGRLRKKKMAIAPVAYARRPLSEASSRPSPASTSAQ